jgi:hypothetical protein
LTLAKVNGARTKPIPLCPSLCDSGPWRRTRHLPQPAPHLQVSVAFEILGPHPQPVGDEAVLRPASVTSKRRIVDLAATSIRQPPASAATSRVIGSSPGPKARTSSGGPAGSGFVKSDLNGFRMATPNAADLAGGRQASRRQSDRPEGARLALAAGRSGLTTLTTCQVWAKPKLTSEATMPCLSASRS